MEFSTFLANKFDFSDRVAAQDTCPLCPAKSARESRLCYLRADSKLIVVCFNPQWPTLNFAVACFASGTNCTGGRVR
jgi:hypothetical protein